MPWLARKISTWFVAHVWNPKVPGKQTFWNISYSSRIFSAQSSCRDCYCKSFNYFEPKKMDSISQVKWFRFSRLHDTGQKLQVHMTFPDSHPVTEKWFWIKCTLETQRLLNCLLQIYEIIYKYQDTRSIHPSKPQAWRSTELFPHLFLTFVIDCPNQVSLKKHLITFGRPKKQLIIKQLELQIKTFSLEFFTAALWLTLGFPNT